jgi:molecular chaperone DnaK (HSP70)
MVSSKFLQLIKEQVNLDIRIEASSGLTAEEIERMKKMQKLTLMLTKVSRERAEKLNEADGMIFQTETQLKELEKLSDENKVAVEYALTELRMAHQSQDIPAVQTALDISMLLGKLLLKQCMLKENKVKMLQARR